MKALLLNGSPHETGCTYTALCEVAASLNREGVETEIVQVGRDTAGGCLGCGGCRETGLCVRGGVLNELLPRLDEFDAFVFGAPVHYASPAGTMVSLLDRLCWAGGAKLRNKPPPLW